MILVTGGAGFIGSNYIRQILQRNMEEVVNVDALKNDGAESLIEDFSLSSNYSFVEGDITNGEMLKDVFSTFRPSSVVHFAAESHVDKSIDSPRVFLESNVMGTFELLNCSSAFLKNYPNNSFKFIHISTDEVFGSLEANEASFTEKTSYKPNSAYSASKAASDHLARAWFHTYGLPTIITNCSNNYGPYQYPEKLIPLVISKALSGDAIPVYGDGQQIRDWLHVYDHCDAISTVLERGNVGETYNIGGDSECTNISIVEKICSLLDVHIPKSDGSLYSTQISFVKDRPGHDLRYSIDFSKIKKDLGWSPTVSLREGIESTVLWYLQNQNWLTENKHQTLRQGLVT